MSGVELLRWEKKFDRGSWDREDLRSLGLVDERSEAEELDENCCRMGTAGGGRGRCTDGAEGGVGSGLERLSLAMEAVVPAGLEVMVVVSTAVRALLATWEG